jgi:hypothetical protein
MVAESTTASGRNLGFLSVVQEPSGFAGGFLVANAWGRPIEFRLSSAVQPNKVQQILYGDTLESYLCGEVIGKTLIDKAAAQVDLVLVDNPLALDVRRCIETPVGLWHAIADPDQPPPGILVQPRLYCHAHFPDDADKLRAMIDGIGSFDFSEPFTRIREAMNEARKMGVTMRRAA